jgi:hypothetical protein
VLHLSSILRAAALAPLVAAILAASGPETANADAPKGGKEAKDGKGAPSDEDIAQAKAHFLKGKALFDKGGKANLKAAVAEFKESYRLSKNPLLLYNIGYTLDQLGDRSMALFYYQKYLTEAPKSDGNRATAQTRVEALESEVDQGSLSEGGEDAAPGAAAPAGKPEGSAAVAPAVDRFQHNVIDEAPPGRPIDVSAFVPADTNYKVLLFFRAAGEAKFSSVPMKPRYNEVIGRIPAGKTTGASVQYYIEVRDESDKLVDRSGKSTSPHLVYLQKGADARYYADLGDESAVPVSEDEVVASGGGLNLSSEEEWTDAGSSKYRRLKWVAAGLAVELVAQSAAFALLSSRASSDLAAEAAASSAGDECAGRAPPCRAFTEHQRSLELRGQRFETWAAISLGVGLAAAAGAGVLWYFERRETRKAREERRRAPDEPTFSATPVVGDDFVGGAAAVRF